GLQLVTEFLAGPLAMRLSFGRQKRTCELKSVVQHLTLSLVRNIDREGHAHDARSVVDRIRPDGLKRAPQLFVRDARPDLRLSKPEQELKAVSAIERERGA